MPVLNYAKETTTTTGTGVYTLSGAVSPYSSFVSRATAELTGGTPWSNILYVVTDGAGGFEFTEGTLTDAASDTLTRGTIHASSNGGAAVNWGAGTKDIYSWAPGSQLTGSLVQSKVATSTSTFATTTATPLQDGSQPIISEGGSIITLSWTPQRTDTETIITINIPMVQHGTAGATINWALWYGSTFVTAGAEGYRHHSVCIQARHDHSATSTVTLDLRAGVSSGTGYINRSSSSATPYGAGSMVMSLVAEERVMS